MAKAGCFITFVPIFLCVPCSTKGLDSTETYLAAASKVDLIDQTMIY